LLEPEYVNKNCITFLWVFDTVLSRIENLAWSKARCANPTCSQNSYQVIFVPCCVQKLFNLPYSRIICNILM
jgi:hypothetical protein